MSASASGGIRFGQYVLLRRIARGGMAEVFLAQQKGLEGFDRRVAVKRILPHLADAPDFVKMFLGEARLAAQLTHPNIVHIYDFGKVDTDYFIAMEYLDGVHTGQLFKHIQERERMPATMVARIGADAAAALHYAHELRNADGQPYGLVHRDVSPANIMVSFDGAVKLCDFGIAKAAALGDQLTNPGQVKGKYAYMSPEQTIAAPLDGRSDVFSLAIVMWELLAGKTIVGRGDAVDAMRAIRDGKLQPIALAAPGTPPALAKALTWAMQTRRETRATAMDFAQALEAFIKSSPELATPMQLGAWVRQRFARDSTGQHAAIPGVSVGTKLAPGTRVAPVTLDAPGTSVSVGTQVGTVTPESSLIAASRTSEIDELLDGVETIDVSAHAAREARAAHAAHTAAAAAAGNATVHVAGDATVIDHNVRGALGSDTIDETMMRSGAMRPAIGGAAAIPTLIQRAADRTPTPASAHFDPTLGVPRARRVPRRVLAVGGLVLIAIISFLIALAARSGRPATPAIAAGTDAGPPPVDAAEVVPTIDDAARTPTIGTDASSELTLLEVRTKPAGATVRVGGETRVAPAKFALTPGTYTITAELDGYQPERRSAELLAGVDLVQEIAFDRRISNRPSTPATPANGRLTVRTTPYSVVFHAGKRLGETPFADLELAPGLYELTFKHPRHAPVKRRVTITAGRTTKLSFALE